jgi:hypothetical protein
LVSEKVENEASCEFAPLFMLLRTAGKCLRTALMFPRESFVYNGPQNLDHAIS